MSKKARGFTLIEVMIAVAIVGILAAIALPSFQAHLRKGRRADTQAFMMDLANRQQQYLLDARSYALDAAFVTTLGATTPTTVVTFYTIVKSKRLSDFLEALSDERLPGRAKLASLAAVWKREPRTPA